MYNFHLLIGSNEYERDCYLNNIAKKLDNPDIKISKIRNSTKKAEVKVILEDTKDLVKNHSKDGFAYSSFFDDEVVNPTLTVLETIDDAVINNFIDLTEYTWESNIFVLIINCKHSSEKEKILNGIDLTNIHVQNIDYMSNEKSFTDFCLHYINHLGLQVNTPELNLVLDSLHFHCKSELKKHGVIDDLDIYTKQKDIVYDQLLATNILDSLQSYSDNPSYEDINIFFSNKIKSLGIEILKKILGSNNSFDASKKLFDALQYLDVSDVRAFLNFFCYSLGEYVKSLDKCYHNKSVTSPYKDKNNLNILRPLKTLDNLLEIKGNFQLSKESILSSISLELHKSLH